MGTLKALKCVETSLNWWTVGKEYVVDSKGFILDDEGYYVEALDMLKFYGPDTFEDLQFDAIYSEDGLTQNVSDGSTASYYELPKNATELQHLISHKNMNAQLGEIFRECYRYGTASHCNELRGIKKILFYANAELERLEKLNK
jgi:hypothetical protein